MSLFLSLILIEAFLPENKKRERRIKKALEIPKNIKEFKF
jgi:hypothetical protein